MQIQFKKYHLIEYPVYQNMGINYNSIVDMATEFYDFIKDEKNINLIFCGSSGCMLATIYFTVINQINPNTIINMVYIRKKGEKSHDILGHKIFFPNKNIFIDDHIFHGETLGHCLKTLRKEKNNFIFDYVVVSWITPKALDKFKNDSNNICFSNKIT